MTEVGRLGWEAVGASVAAGDLYLEPGVASRCAKRCAEFAAELRALRDEAKALGRVDGFGPLPSGVALATKFAKKAVGGDYSMVDAIGDHIVEVERMQATFEQIEAMYGASEQRGVDGITGAGGGL
ncbi:hypothetical protein [Rhodococcus sp. NPDC058514]|uniref:hypothetical protein n=1 Tax=unclassified Rhodococcus (in: high G+C Gram-positive bacteria) TaxID=192944 RepID=UPI003659BB4F